MRIIQPDETQQELGIVAIISVFYHSDYPCELIVRNGYVEIDGSAVFRPDEAIEFASAIITAAQIARNSMKIGTQIPFTSAGNEL